jgi:hypothetical protein
MLEGTSSNCRWGKVSKSATVMARLGSVKALWGSSLTTARQRAASRSPGGMKTSAKSGRSEDSGMESSDPRSADSTSLFDGSPPKTTEDGAAGKAAGASVEARDQARRGAPAGGGTISTTLTGGRSSSSAARGMELEPKPRSSCMGRGAEEWRRRRGGPTEEGKKDGGARGGKRHGGGRGW